MENIPSMLTVMFSYQQTFLDELERFMTATGLNPTQFGKQCPLKDPGFVFRMRKGRSASGRTMDRVREWMREQRPDVISNGAHQ